MRRLGIIIRAPVRGAVTVDRLVAVGPFGEVHTEVFSPISLAPGDAIQFNYTLTAT